MDLGSGGWSDRSDRSDRSDKKAAGFLGLVCEASEYRLEEIHPAGGGMNLQNPAVAGLECEVCANLRL